MPFHLGGPNILNRVRFGPTNEWYS
jgi:hypothetical protein